MAQDDGDTSIEQWCIAFDLHLDSMFEIYHDTEVDFVEMAITELKDLLKMQDDVTLTDVFNNTMYDWYYGNFFTKMLTLIFQPYLYSKPCFMGSYAKRLSEVQIRAMYRLAYKLITEGTCIPDQKDYYNETPFTYILRCEKDHWRSIPDDIKEWMPSFRYLFKHGTNVINRQQEYIRRWHRAYRQKRKDAVGVIESWWLEIILNPDTHIGKKKLKVLEQHFHTYAHAHSHSHPQAHSHLQVCTKSIANLV